MNDLFSFTGIVYTLLTIVFLFVTFRFYKDWKKDATTSNRDLFLSLLFFTFVCIAGVFAGTVFLKSASGIIILLIISSFFVTLASSFLGHLFFHFKFPSISAWWGFIFIFIYGLFVTILTAFSRITPFLEKNGALDWGMPFYIDILRSIIYFLGCIPAYFIFLKKYKDAENRFEKSQNLFLMMVFIAALVIIIVDFIIEPWFHTKANLSEIFILVTAVIGMFLYFILNETVVSKSEELFRSIFEQANDGLFLHDLRGNLLDVNQKALDIFGLSRKELLDHKNSKVKKIIHEVKVKGSDDLNNPRSFQITDALLKNKKIPPYERMYKKDGKKIIMEINNTLIRNKHQEPLFVLSIVRDISERKMSERKLLTALKEKEVLLQEIHHRVKNNIQIMSSLLRLQFSDINSTEIKEKIKESQNRLRSIALIHEKLYRSRDFSQINFRQYIHDLTIHLSHIYDINPSEVKAKTEVNDLFFNINTAVPLGLIINELISNAFKHAFPDKRRGEVLIRLKLTIPDKYKLEVIDNGVGFPAEIDFKNPQTLGLQLLYDLVNQIDGKIRLNKNDGTCISIEFKSKTNNLN